MCSNMVLLLYLTQSRFDFVHFCAHLPLCERVYSLFCRDTSLPRVVVNGTFKEKRDVRTACCVCSVQKQRSELRHWRTHAGQDWTASAKRMKVEAHCGERGKVPKKERQDYPRSPCSLTFMPLKRNTFPTTLSAFWIRNTAFAFQREKCDCLF